MAGYTILPAGDTALVVDFGDRIDQQISARVVSLGRRLQDLCIAGVIETVPTTRSLSVYFEPLTLSCGTLRERIEALMPDDLPAAEGAGRTWRLPVCYDRAVAPDLDEVAGRCGMPAAEVVERHSAIGYHVYMLGFLPGLAYLGDLPEALALPRRETPRPRIPAGSVGIGGRMSCIYPMETPCGWHLIGRSPALLWDQRRDTAALLAAGDRVELQPVSLREFERLRAAGGGAGARA